MRRGTNRRLAAIADRSSRLVLERAAKTFSSALARLRDHPFIGRLQSFPDPGPLLAPPPDAKMGLAQFLHEFGPHFRAAFSQQFGADAEFCTDGQIFDPPARH